MADIIDLHELNTTAALISDALDAPLSAEYQLYQRREEQLLYELKQQYATSDLFQLLHNINAGFTTEKIDALYAVYRQILRQYISFDGVADIPEMDYYQRDNDKSIANLNKWNQSLAKQLYDLHDNPENGRFKGLLLVYSLVVENLYEQIKKAP